MTENLSGKRAEQKNGAFLAVLLVAPFMIQADATIVNVAIPSIRAGLDATDMALQWVMDGYLICFAVLVITGARLGQTHGYKKIFILGLSLFIAASLLGGLSAEPLVLIAARVLQGIGAAFMYPQTLTGIQMNFAGSARSRAIGLLAMALSIGAVSGQIIGGILIAADLFGTGWRAIFLINVPVGVATAFGAWRYLPADTERQAHRLDWAGVGTLTASLLLFVLPLTVGRATGWPVWVWLCIAVSLPVFGIFVLSQQYVRIAGGEPLINLEVLMRPAIYWSLLTLLIATGTYYALLFTLAQYLQQGLGRSALFSGLILVPWVAAFGMAGQVMSRLPGRVAPLAPCLGCCVLACAYLVIGAGLAAGLHNVVALALLLAMGGFGLGLQFSGLLVHLTNAVPTRYAPDVSGVTTTTLQVGGACGVAVFGALFLASAEHPGTWHAAQPFAVTMFVMAGAALIAAVSAYRATHADVTDESARAGWNRPHPAAPHCRHDEPG